MVDVTADAAELARRLEDAREQQRAVSALLATMARAEGLQPVLEEVIAAATGLCSGGYGALYLLEGDLLHAASQSGSLEPWEYDKRHPFRIDRTTLVGRTALVRAPVHIPDILDDPEYAYAGPRTGFRAMLGIPILVERDLIGVIGITRSVPEPFTEDQIELVKTFADQAAIAIANARLIETVERQLEQQRTVAGVLRVVARSEGLDAVFRSVVESAARLCDAERGELHLAEGQLLRFAAGYGYSEEVSEHSREHPHEPERSTCVGRVALTRDVVHIPDVTRDPEYAYPAEQLGGYRAILGAPIFLDEELLGVVHVVRSEPEPFSDEQIELVRTFADQAAIAIANARLLDAVERQRTELARFVSPQVAELLSSEEGERLLAGHRRYVTVLFCDLRGFTAFTETAEPEELLEVLHQYHLALGSLIPHYEGTFKDFAGDGLTLLFNDPIPVDDHELKAIRFALAAHEQLSELAAGWRKRGITLGLGVGIASGYATLGRIGFEGRYDYGALGAVTNLAARLTSHAAPGQTLVSQRVYAAVEEYIEAEPVGELELKGFGRPVVAYEVRGLRAD